MAIDFSVKEARKLIDRHKELLSNLDHITSEASGLQSSIKQSANDLITQTVLKRLILNDCSRPSAIPRSAELERLIYNLYKYQKVHSAIETTKSFQRFAEENVRQNIRLLNPGLAGLSWFLGGKRVKESAVQAYQELTTILGESYGQMIPNLVSEIDATAYIPVDTAWDTFTADPVLFTDTLESICPEVVYAKGYNPFQPQLTQLANLEQKVSKCQTVTSKEKGQIKAAAEKMMAFNALQILRNVPVEEVNREKVGFRVKTLRDAGLTTMADIYASSSYQLSSLYGISEHAAFSIKRIAQQFWEEAQKDVKIKLSADDRSKQATALVKAIYVYRLKNASREELGSVIQDRQNVLAQAQNSLDAVGNGLPWLFYFDEQRADVRNAYTEIKAAVDGEYAQAINRLTNILLTDKAAPPADTVWNDFQEHNIEYISVLEDIVPGVLGNDDSLYGLPEDLAREIQEEVLFPDGLLCTLRRYQEWGVKYILHQKRFF